MNLKPAAAAMVAKKALPIKKSMKGMKKAGKTDFAKKHWYISHMKNKSLHAIRIELSEGGFWVTDVYSSKAAGTVTTAKQLTAAYRVIANGLGLKVRAVRDAIGSLIQNID